MFLIEKLCIFAEGYEIGRATSKQFTNYEKCVMGYRALCDDLRKIVLYGHEIDTMIFELMRREKSLTLLLRVTDFSFRLCEQVVGRRHKSWGWVKAMSKVYRRSSCS